MIWCISDLLQICRHHIQRAKDLTIAAIVEGLPLERGIQIVEVLSEMGAASATCVTVELPMSVSQSWISLLIYARQTAYISDGQEGNNLLPQLFTQLDLDNMLQNTASNLKLHWQSHTRLCSGAPSWAQAHDLFSQKQK